jgi:ADP-ribosylglycohydrolase
MAHLSLCFFRSSLSSAVEMILCRRAEAVEKGLDISERKAIASMEGAWTGKISAGSGALATEGWSRDRIKKEYGELSDPPRTPDAFGPLDDTTLMFLSLVTAEEKGSHFTSEDIARNWVKYITDTKGGGFGSLFKEGLERLRQEIMPPNTAPRFDDWISAQMRAEIWGMLAPGRHDLAAEFARRDAVILNAGNGVYAAQYVAAMMSRIMVDGNIENAIHAAFTVVPEDCAVAQLVGDIIRWHGEHPDDWGKAWDLMVKEYSDYVEDDRPRFKVRILPEIGTVMIGMLYGDADFRRTVSITTMCGFDTDCNAGTVGALIGARNGVEGIPPEWKDPLEGMYRVKLGGGMNNEWRIAEVARKTLNAAKRIARE